MDKLISEQAAIQPEQQHGRVFKEIVVEYPSYSIYTEYIGKPYFSIKYMGNGQEFIGYGTYGLEVLSEYLKEYFMPSAQPEPKTVRDTLNSMTDDKFAEWLCHQIFPDYGEDNAINDLRYKSVRNFLEMDIKQAKEGGADMRGQNNDTTD